MSEDEIRKEFEKLYVACANSQNISRNRWGEYESVEADMAWWGYLAGRNAALEAAREAAGMLRHGYHMKETSLAPARPFPWQIFDELDEAIRALKHTPEQSNG